MKCVYCGQELLIDYHFYDPATGEKMCVSCRRSENYLSEHAAKIRKQIREEKWYLFCERQGIQNF